MPFSNCLTMPTTTVRKFYPWQLRIHKQQTEHKAPQLAARDTMGNSCLPFSMNSQIFNTAGRGMRYCRNRAPQTELVPSCWVVPGHSLKQPCAPWDALPTGPRLSLQQANFPQPNPKLFPQNPHTGLWSALRGSSRQVMKEATVATSKLGFLWVTF